MNKCNYSVCWLVTQSFILKKAIFNESNKTVNENVPIESSCIIWSVWKQCAVALVWSATAQPVSPPAGTTPVWLAHIAVVQRLLQHHYMLLTASLSRQKRDLDWNPALMDIIVIVCLHWCNFWNEIHSGCNVILICVSESMEMCLDADSPITSSVLPCTPDFYLKHCQQVQRSLLIQTSKSLSVPCHCQQVQHSLCLVSLTWDN